MSAEALHFLDSFRVAGRNQQVVRRAGNRRRPAATSSSRTSRSSRPLPRQSGTTSGASSLTRAGLRRASRAWSSRRGRSRPGRLLARNAGAGQGEAHGHRGTVRIDHRDHARARPAFSSLSAWRDNSSLGGGQRRASQSPVPQMLERAAAHTSPKRCRAASSSCEFSTRTSMSPAASAASSCEMMDSGSSSAYARHAAGRLVTGESPSTPDSKAGCRAS